MRPRSHSQLTFSLNKDLLRYGRNTPPSHFLKLHLRWTPGSLGWILWTITFYDFSNHIKIFLMRGQTIIFNQRFRPILEMSLVLSRGKFPGFFLPIILWRQKGVKSHKRISWSMGWANTQWVGILATDVFLFSQYIYQSNRNCTKAQNMWAFHPIFWFSFFVILTKNEKTAVLSLL